MSHKATLMHCSRCRSIIDDRYIGKPCPSCGYNVTGMPRGINESFCPPPPSSGRAVFANEENTAPPAGHAEGRPH